MIRTQRFFQWVTIFILSLFVTGCSFVFHKRSPEDVRAIDTLESEVSRLSRELQELEAIKRDLERRLRDEIAKGQLDLQVEDRGLVIRSLGDVYFDSGKASIRPEGVSILRKVAKAVQELGDGRKISVEGHTDNQPIKRSGWRSNQELSEARAKSVASFLEKEGVSGLSTRGFADTKPVASNDTKEGRQRNRRVEIIILSQEIRQQNFTGRGSTIK